MFVYDRQTNNGIPQLPAANPPLFTPPLLNDILLTDVNNPEPIHLAYPNPNTSERYIVVRDSVHTLCIDGDSSLYKEVKASLKTETIYNTNTTGTIQDINTGSLYFVAISSLQPNAIADQPNFDLHTRIRYKDA